MRLGAAVKRAAMMGENNSNIERHEIESDFRNFGQYNKYLFEESIRPNQVNAQGGNVQLNPLSPPQVVSPSAGMSQLVSPKPMQTGTALNQSSLYHNISALGKSQLGGDSSIAN